MDGSIRQLYALDRHVLVVAKANKWVGDWAAYIGAVPGQSHTTEAEEVLHHGSKVSHAVASVMFPYFDRNYEWRQ